MYPDSLLPKPDYVSEMNVDQMLADEVTLIFVRRSDCPLEEIETVSGDYMLSEDCVSDDVFNYSMNLLGAGFDVASHLRIRQTGDGWKCWLGDQFLSAEEIERSWVEVEGYPIYYRAKDLHNKTFPYQRVFEKKKDFTAKMARIKRRDLKPAEDIWSPEAKSVSLWGILRVNHAPSFMNYWHVTWDAYEPDQLTSPITKGKGKWRDEIRGYMIEYLRRNYIKEDAWVDYHVDPKYYMKS